MPETEQPEVEFSPDLLQFIAGCEVGSPQAQAALDFVTFRLIDLEIIDFMSKLHSPEESNMVGLPPELYAEALQSRLRTLEQRSALVQDRTLELSSSVKGYMKQSKRISGLARSNLSRITDHNRETSFYRDLRTALGQRIMRE